ncbi:MAG: DUF5654 family protein [bacterium]|nr:DUF5654 family protein [bacterium]
MKPSIRETIHTALITALTIAAALIWKDVVSEIIQRLIPQGEQLLFQIISALIATFIIILTIALVQKTESEAEYIIGEAEEAVRRYRNKNHATDRDPKADSTEK